MTNTCINIYVLYIHICRYKYIETTKIESESGKWVPISGAGQSHVCLAGNPGEEGGAGPNPNLKPETGKRKHPGK